MPDFKSPSELSDLKKPEVIPLWTVSGESSSHAFITIHRPAKSNGVAVIICPGGGYGCLVNEPEGHGIARWLNEKGLVGVVLEYRLPQGNQTIPIMDAQRALRLVRSKSPELGCCKVGIMGFSAGGHLASTAATHFDLGNPKAADPLDRISSRPDFSILIYPVITMGEKGHEGSRTNLLGANQTPEAIKEFSNELQVTVQTPPSFLAHALDDSTVPFENSQMFYDALQSFQIPSRYLQLPSGGHGLNGYAGPMWESWKTESLRWLGEQGIIPS